MTKSNSMLKFRFSSLQPSLVEQSSVDLIDEFVVKLGGASVQALLDRFVHHFQS
jgi:hypothetical protein